MRIGWRVQSIVAPAPGAGVAVEVTRSLRESLLLK